MNLLCFPLHWLGIKATFLFPPNSVSRFFIRLQGAEKAKILSSNTTRILRSILWKPAAQWVLPSHSSSPGSQTLQASDHTLEDPATRVPLGLPGLWTGSSRLTWELVRSSQTCSNQNLHFNQKPRWSWLSGKSEAPLRALPESKCGISDSPQTPSPEFSWLCAQPGQAYPQG